MIEVIGYLLLIAFGIAIGAYFKRSADESKFQKVYHDGEVKGWNDHDRICNSEAHGAIAIMVFKKDGVKKEPPICEMCAWYSAEKKPPICESTDDCLDGSRFIKRLGA